MQSAIADVAIYKSLLDFCFCSRNDFQCMILYFFHVVFLYHHLHKLMALFKLRRIKMQNEWNWICVMCFSFHYLLYFSDHFMLLIRIVQSNFNVGFQQTTCHFKFVTSLKVIELNKFNSIFFNQLFGLSTCTNLFCYESFVFCLNGMNVVKLLCSN